MSPDPHAARSDAAAYWRQFPIAVHFQEPCQVAGRLLELGEVKSRDEWLPRLRLQDADGRVYTVLVGQTRLLSALAEKCPAVGDDITITYHGEAKKAAPGMNPTKEFTVEVRRGVPSTTGRGRERDADSPSSSSPTAAAPIPPPLVIQLRTQALRTPRPGLDEKTLADVVAVVCRTAGAPVVPLEELPRTLANSMQKTLDSMERGALELEYAENGTPRLGTPKRQEAETPT